MLTVSKNGENCDTCKYASPCVKSYHYNSITNYIIVYVVVAGERNHGTKPYADAIKHLGSSILPHGWFQ